MTAKPQPMAGQPDGADDLIAELAKLMAQDAKTDRPADGPSRPFSVRIPGGDETPAPSLGPAPRFDFGRTAAPVAQPTAAAPAAAAPVAKPDQTQAAAEPFRFDFKPAAPTSPVPPAPVEVAKAPVPEKVEPAMEAESTVDYDSIADLIAAELAADASPTPIAQTPPPVAPTVSPAASQANAGWKPAVIQAETKPAEDRPAPRDEAPQPAPEPDRFKVAPVFGLGSRPATAEPTVAPVAARPTPTPSATVPPVAAVPEVRQPELSIAPEPDDGLGRDPIDEIESLIGRAMRVEFDAPESEAEPMPAARPAPSPALRSLATPVATQATPAARPESRRVLSGADEAIFAAAEATGAQIDWVDAPSVDEPKPAATAGRKQRQPRQPRESRGISRAVAGPLVAVTLLLAAGFGLYWVLGLGRESGPAPLLTADASPIKETPAAQPEETTPQQSIVFNEIDGVVPGAEEQLVSRDQADVNEVTQVPAAPAVSEEGLANRKVRTVTVRPDGTIVSGDEGVAGNAILPVDRPNVPEVPGAEDGEPSLLASTDATTATPAATTGTTATSADPIAAAIDSATAEADTAVAAPPAVTPVQPGSTVQAVDASGTAIAGRTAVIPMTRPANLRQATAPTTPTTVPTSPVNAVVDSPSAANGGNMLPPPPTASTLGALTPQQPTTTTATQPTTAAAAQTPATTTSTSIPGAVEVDAIPNSAAAYAQLASLRTEEEARQAAQNLVTRFGPVFGGANMEVQRVDLGARGVYYRVRVPAASRDAANNICTNVVAAGGDCVAM